MFKNMDLKRTILVFVAVTCMGFALSFLVRVNGGGDPYTCMNLGISALLPVSFGTWQAILNVGVLILIIIFDRSLIGIGTLANMFLVGYSMDFFTWIENQMIPTGALDGMAMRIVVAAPAFVLFTIAAALYMSCEMGVAPYDALVFLIHRKVRSITKKNVPFRMVRIPFDGLACVIGFVLGSQVGVVTILIMLFMGPAVEQVSKLLKKIGIVEGDVNE